MRPSGRAPNQLRHIDFIVDFTKHAEGSVLVSFGETRVLCTASITDNVPRFVKGTGKGWLTAEYGMLPRSTHSRVDREASRGKQSGRTLEIQRLIGRALRAAIDLSIIGERTIYIDCDVLQADGGTRTAAITGACLALAKATHHMLQEKMVASDPLQQLIASVSVGLFNGQAVLDLDYAEDSNAETDMNIVMNEKGQFIEIQGTAENEAFTENQLSDLIGYAKAGIETLLAKQREIINTFLITQKT